LTSIFLDVQSNPKRGYFVCKVRLTSLIPAKACFERAAEKSSFRFLESVFFASSLSGLFVNLRAEK
jgi:hypothetical protein